MSETAKKKNKFPNFKFAIPKPTFKDTPMNAFLVVALVIFSFLLGMLTNKVIFLEQQLKNPTTAAAGDAQPQGPTPPPFVENLETGKLPLLGNKDAKVTVIEFSDFQCPFCKKYFDDNHSKLVEKYIETGKVKFAYRHFPLSSIHPLAQRAAEASECANEQGKFWEYHDLLFKEQDTWSPLTDTEAISSFVDYAGQVGANADQFRSCIENEKYKANVDEDTAIAGEIQVDATPTLFINGTRLVGAVPFADLERAIEAELKK
jgi:protein-disulfide isomerase